MDLLGDTQDEQIIQQPHNRTAALPLFTNGGSRLFVCDVFCELKKTHIIDTHHKTYVNDQGFGCRKEPETAKPQAGRQVNHGHGE